MPARHREALLVLVGITARRRDRRRVGDYFRSHGPYDVFVPAVPQWQGLNRSRRWLLAYLRRRIEPGGYGRVHVLNYISGGLLFRAIAPRTRTVRFGRVVYVRSPMQELLPSRLAQRYGDLGLVLTKGLGLLDLARGAMRDLPFPPTGLEQGLIVEERPSAMARALGIGRDTPPPGAWETSTLLPSASDRLSVQASHDEVYRCETLFEKALCFFDHGNFSGSTTADAAAAADSE